MALGMSSMARFIRVMKYLELGTLCESFHWLVRPLTHSSPAQKSGMALQQ